jgi:hypothetical protein
MSLNKLTKLNLSDNIKSLIKSLFLKQGEIIDYLNRYLTPEDQYQTTIVNISSSQILNMGTTPVELLPAPGENKYYDIEKIILEFTYGTVPYSDPDEPLRIIGNGADVYISREIIISEQNLASISTDTQLKIQNNGPDSYVYRRVIPSNEALSIIINGGVDVTNGDGTMRAVIKYKVRTFGE